MEKIYTFGIRDNRGEWHYLTTKYQIAPMQLRHAHYQDLKNTEESAKKVLSNLDENKFDFETATLFELVINVKPFNSLKNIK